MTNNAQEKQPPSRLEAALEFLEQDPLNLPLLADAASLAFDDADFDLAARLIQRHADVAPLPPSLVNLQGLLALSQGRLLDAAEVFSALRDQGKDSPALRFNLAWCKAMTGAWQDALDLLDDESVAASRRAPALKIQVLHHLQRLKDALDCGKMLSERYPDDGALMGALANVAIDAEDAVLAASYAKRAGDTAEGKAALGILSLGEQDASGSLVMFEDALRRDPDNARALVGKGLAQLSSGDLAGGTAAIDRGAELFRTHIGSWVAAGWGHFTAGDYPAARLRFEKAMALDPNFAETHGGIAVLNAVEGNLHEAARECEIAQRLDRNCFGAALAKSILLQRRGHPEMAQKVVNVAMSTPVGLHGETLAQMLATFGNGRRP